MRRRKVNKLRINLLENYIKFFLDVLQCTERAEPGRKACIGCACAKRGMPFDLASEASEENRRFYAAMPVEEEGKARETEGFAQLCPRKG